MSSPEHVPTWQFRSPYRRATEAPTAAAAVDLVTGMSHGYDRSRMLLAIARRPDLTAKVLDRMLNDRSIGHDSQWANALMQSNPRLAATKPGRALINRDLMYVLVSSPDGFEQQIVEYIAGMHIGDPLASEFATLARASIGAQKVRDLAHEYACRDADALRIVASSVLMDDGLWGVALDALPRTKKATREHGMEVVDLVTTLSRRPDLTSERAERLIAAMHPRMRRFMVMALFGNRACPVSAFVAAATDPDKGIVDAALSEPHCPDEARFAAVLAGRTYVLGAVRSAIPDDVAAAALSALAGSDDDDEGDEGEDGLTGANAKMILSTLTRLSDSTHVLNACFDLYLARYAHKSDAVAAFTNDLMQHHSTHVLGWKERDRLDTGGEFLAGHADPDLRRAAIRYLHPDDLAAAATDPDPKVRAEVAARPDLPTDFMDALVADPSLTVRRAVAGHAAAPDSVLTAFTADPDPRVRVVAAQHPAASSAVLAILANDPDERVRVEAAKHDHLSPQTLASLGGDSSATVCGIVADRFMGALTAEPVSLDG